MNGMTTDRMPPRSSGDLFRGLLDDASLFPPADLPMPVAVAAHVRHSGAWYHSLAGPFVCPATRLDELRTVLTTANVPEIDLALVVADGAAAVATATDAVAADPRLRLRAVEVPAARNGGQGHSAAEVAAALDGALLAGAACYIEIPIGVLADPATSGEVLAIIDGRGYRPKLRTGGLSAAAFPDEPALASALAAIAGRNVPFKCTAGLHHAVRHTAADTGFEHHGFLNALLATGSAAAGADIGDIAGVLAERDPALVARQILALGPGATADIRGLFTSFGTCSTDEPVADLIALGLISQS
jgi:hypothetical protein